MSGIEEKRWFGPKLLGWGWSPRRPEGWVVMGLFLVTIWLSYRVLGRGLLGKLVRLKVGALLLIVLVITGGKPGSLLMQRGRAGLDPVSKGSE